MMKNSVTMDSYKMDIFEWKFLNELKNCFSNELGIFYFLFFEGKEAGIDILHHIDGLYYFLRVLICFCSQKIEFPFL